MRIILALLYLVPSGLLAQPSMEHQSINSRYIDETRMLNIILPDKYHESTKKYPIVLVLDHGLLFHTTSTIVNHLSNTTRMPESIVVSIGSGNKHRNHFAPNLYNNHRDKRYNYGDHQEDFINFLELELLPLLEEKYRLTNFKTFIGFSPSSVIGLYTLLNKPNLFQAYICFAAGNIIGDGYNKDERLIEELAQLYGKSEITQNFLYVVSGSKDADSQPYINTNIKDFNDKLAVFNTGNIHTKAETIEGEGHTEVILPGLINAFEFMFPKEKWYADYLNLITKEGKARRNIESFYENLSNEYGFKVYPNVDRLYSMSCLKNIGRSLLRNEKIEEAIEIYTYWIEGYPGSHLAHYYLGLSYKENQDTSNAEASFKKAFELAQLQNSTEVKIYREALIELTN